MQRFQVFPRLVGRLGSSSTQLFCNTNHLYYLRTTGSYNRRSSLSVFRTMASSTDWSIEPAKINKLREYSACDVKYLPSVLHTFC